ncbi:MAG: DUF1800 family protein, partial [Verrucomicrobia bacterium]|nr:DUF1800 family protein [Verrucomicrobiota bacterium]
MKLEQTKPGGSRNSSMLSQLPKEKWTYDAAAHLAARAGFGESPSRLEQWTQQGMEATIQQLLHPDTDNTPPPSSMVPDQFAGLRGQVRDATSPDQKKEARRALRQATNQQLYHLINWWTRRMLTTPAPLVEK